MLYAVKDCSCSVVDPGSVLAHGNEVVHTDLDCRPRGSPVPLLRRRVWRVDVLLESVGRVVYDPSLEHYKLCHHVPCHLQRQTKVPRQLLSSTLQGIWYRAAYGFVLLLGEDIDKVPLGALCHYHLPEAVVDIVLAEV